VTSTIFIGADDDRREENCAAEAAGRWGKGWGKQRTDDVSIEFAAATTLVPNVKRASAHWRDGARVSSRGQTIGEPRRFVHPETEC
jgi:hypothetical protein